MCCVSVLRRLNLTINILCNCLLIYSTTVLAQALFVLCTIATGCSVCLFVYVYLFTYICAVVFHLEKEGLEFLVCNIGTSTGRPSTVARCYTLEFDNAGFSSSDFLDKGIFFYVSEHITTAFWHIQWWCSDGFVPSALACGLAETSLRVY